MQRVRQNLSGLLSDTRHNILLMVLAQAIESIASALTYIVVGRLLGPDSMGLWSAVVATTAIVYGFVNLALNIPVAREAARNRHSAMIYLGSAWLLVVVWTIPATVALSLGVGMLVGFRQAALWAILLVALSMGIGSLSSLWLAIFIALGRFEYCLYLNLAIRLMGAVLLALVVYFIPNIFTVLAMSLVTHAVFCIVAFALASSLIGPILPRWNFSLFRALFTEAIPITLASVMTHIGLRVDALMMERLRGTYEAGIYSAAYSVYMFGGVLLYSATIVFFPKFAQHSNPLHSDTELFRSLFMRAACGLVAIGGLGTILGWLGSGHAIRLLYGAQFDGSLLPLRLLVVGFPFVGLNRLGYQALNASNRQIATLLTTFIGASFNVVANLLLIPHWGYIAASLTTVATEALMALVFVIFVLLKNPALLRRSFLGSATGKMAEG